MLRTFDHIHQRAEYGDQCRHRDQKHDDLLLAATQRRQQVIGLPQVGAELEHPEDPQHTDDPHDQQVLRIAVIDRQHARHDRQQVHQPVETEGVLQRPWRAIEAQHVFDGKHQREAPFDPREKHRVITMNTLDAVDDSDQQTEQNRDQHRLVKRPPGRRIGLENNNMQPLAAAERAVHGASRIKDRESLGALGG